jgi:hypothetical protein
MLLGLPLQIGTARSVSSGAVQFHIGTAPLTLPTHA